jgi:hypothetical protein
LGYSCFNLPRRCSAEVIAGIERTFESQHVENIFGDIGVKTL